VLCQLSRVLDLLGLSLGYVLPVLLLVLFYEEIRLKPLQSVVFVIIVDLSFNLSNEVFGE
jgi:hypothetical protein